MKFSRSAQLLGVLAASVFWAGVGASQQPSVAATDSRTRAIVASFNKSKHVVKEKHGVRKEKYLDVRSAPVVKQNPADYSGEYEDAGLGSSLRLRVDRDGKVEGTGHEQVFINKTAFESPTDKGITSFGLGVIGKGLQVGGLNIDRIFYQLKQ